MVKEMLKGDNKYMILITGSKRRVLKSMSISTRDSKIKAGVGEAGKAGGTEEAR